MKQCQERRRMNAAERCDGASTFAAGAVENLQVADEITSISTTN